MHRPDWLAHNARRYAAFPIVTLLAERFASTVAPASAAYVDGGIGTHTSSQISTCKAKPGRSLASKIRSLPNGASCPATRTSRPAAAKPEVNCRRS